jgi:hypothetical protein
MSKRQKSKKSQSEEAKQMSMSEAPVERIHRPRILRSHVAQEFRDRGSIELAEEATRRLMPNLRGRVQGLRENHYVHKGWVSLKRARIKGIDE